MRFAVAVVAQVAALLRHTLPAVLALAVGSLATLGTAVILAGALGLPDVIRASISLKSVTAPIIHGSPVLTAAFVIATGMIGAMLGPWLMDTIGIRDPLTRGLALGTISHGQGAAQAVTEGERQGAAAGVGMGLAAAITSAIAPFLLPILS